MIHWKKVVILITVVLAFLVLEYVSYDLPPAAVALEGKLSEAQKKAIDLLVDLTKLFITFSFGIIGGLAYFLKDTSGGPVARSRYEAILFGVTAVMALGCIYFGHIVLTAVIEMLSNDFLELTSALIISSVRCQYICLVTSVLCLIAYTVERRPIAPQSESSTQQEPSADWE